MYAAAATGAHLGIHGRSAQGEAKRGGILRTESSAGAAFGSAIRQAHFGIKADVSELDDRRARYLEGPGFAGRRTGEAVAHQAGPSIGHHHRGTRLEAHPIGELENRRFRTGRKTIATPVAEFEEAVFGDRARRADAAGP